VQWIRQIAKGNREAFEKLFRAYSVRLFRYLITMVRDKDTAEELTNDVLLAAWKGAAEFRGQSKPSTWLFGIARHKALNELRRTNSAVVDLEEAGEIAESGEGPEELLEREALQRCVVTALRELTPSHREVIELAFYQELSYQEIAEIMQCSVNTVKTRMFYAKKRLREHLEKAGIAGDVS
jgi:RNA polymerase sigma-70 factor, ECF subfamily